MQDSFSFSNIQQAADRLKGRVVRTPVLESPMLNQAAGCRVLVKAESLQRTGAFKYRGALNKLLSLPSDIQKRGIVAFSSGNHGHAVAAAAAEVGCPAVIVLPKDAAAIKIENCRWWGAEIVLYDPNTEDREEVGRSIAGPRNMLVVPPFDDYDIIAGQGTAGLELAEQLDEQGIRPDAFVVPCSGGGLASGTTTAMKHVYPDLQCFFVEPAGLEKMAPSLREGAPQKRPAGPPTVMDGLSGPIVGTRTSQVLGACEPRGLSVSDEEVLDAMSMAFRYLKLVLEPAGAATLAAVLRRKADFEGKSVAIVCSGGNVDPSIFIQALNAS
ncbi:threonine dehydratase catabolic (plasmid) [Cupriavidus necator N-1]|uniref:Threonine dehydratase catabolic n=1 Tax=Cupriavidus necator (strain ATCC 43291 / DSM 13513 / CCUG 52238 / LMG 8453 / N-1) TaxID=1042878 RepID=F8GUJ9_CUPNN|nr:threonine/serine dehydratase [Cupriavidus necator]AEI82403.1 threonine dehydratase catabolic [Cupriavidus necator N-1]MDX6007414.1 threonine/serine dehydratase [Cupriavidus necator]